MSPFFVGRNVKMTSGEKRIYRLLNSSYFFIFFGIGAIFPLLAVYLKHLGFSGKEIGILTAIGPIVTILTQPLWGVVSDRYQIQKQVLLFGMSSIMLIALLFPVFQSFWGTFLMIFIFHMFQSPIIPLTDNIALNFTNRTKIEYGNIRLWGAIGFALAVYITGRITEWTRLEAIFYTFSTAIIIAILSIATVPSDAKRVHVNIWGGVRQLIVMPHFILFLLSSFFVFGTMNANNYYFGVYYQDIGGTIAGIGLAFLLSAGSEAPFMRIGGRIIGKIGLENTLLIASITSLVRWTLFYFIHDPTLIIMLFFLQGVSIGLYLTAAPQYVKSKTPKGIHVTALTLYASFGHGIGTMTCNLVGGWIYETFSIFTTYLFFAVLTLFGIGSLILLKRMGLKN